MGNVNKNQKMKEQVINFIKNNYENIINCQIREDGTGAFQWWHTWYGLKDGYSHSIESTFYRVGGIEVIGGGIRRFFPYQMNENQRLFHEMNESFEFASFMTLNNVPDKTIRDFYQGEVDEKTFEQISNLYKELKG